MSNAKLIHCEEWEKIPIGIEDTQISPTEIHQIEQVWRQKTGKRPTVFFDYSSQTIAPKNWVGSISAPGIKLQVSPKGAKDLDGGEREKLDINLGYMLRAGLYDYSVFSLSSELSGSGNQYERSLEALCDLIQIARRNKVLRRYRTHKTVSQNYRGHLVFPRQAYLQIARPNKFYTRQVELDESIPENIFLKSVLSIFHWRTSGAIRRRIEECLIDFERVETSSNPLSIYKLIRFDRLSNEYVRSIRLAKDLLEGKAVGLFAGSFLGQSTVIFMPELFQTFVSRLVTDIFKPLGFEVISQQRGRYLGAWESGPSARKNSFELIPDIEMKEFGQKQTILLLDAKWKLLSLKSNSLGIAEQDAYQVVSYCTRFDCNKAVLIYPWIDSASPFGKLPATITIPNRSASVRVSVVCVPLLWKNQSTLITDFQTSVDYCLRA